MIKLFQWIFTILFLSVPAHGTTPSHIRDPKRILEKLDSFEERRSFTETFPCEASLIYERHRCGKFCEPFQCIEVCDPSIKTEDITITKCSSDSISFSSNGKIFMPFTIKDFERMNHLRSFFDAPLTGTFVQPGHPIGKSYIVLDDADEETFKLVNGTSLPALRIHFTYFHWDEITNGYLPSKQSIVYGKASQSNGLFLEHQFIGYKHPISRVIEIKKPRNRGQNG